MRLPGLLTLIVVLLVPSVSAGSEGEPEITDPRDQREAWKDILAVWFEDDPEGVKFTIKIASLSAPRPGVLYTVAWNSRETVAIGFDGTRALRSGVDTENGWTPEGGGPGRLDDALRDESFTPGSPAYISAVIPTARFGFEDGDVLRDLFARTVYFDATAQTWVTESEIANAQKTFTVGGGFFPILVPRWVIPTIVVACVAGGMGAGLAIARRKPSAPAPVATNVPVRMTRAPPPPPGQRFQRAPPRE